VVIGSLVILLLLTAAAPWLIRASPRIGTLALAAGPFALGCWFASALGRIASGGVIDESRAWLGELGVELAFRVDGLSLAFALLICFIGSFVLLYASSYLKGSPRLGSFCATLLAFMVSMLGLVLADNMIVLFIFWELTSITSFLLIGFENERESARKAALQALLVTGLGGLAMLAGLVLLGVAAGGFNMSGLAGAGPAGHPWYGAGVVLVLLGAFSKSAIFPFHFWLPNAMEAPSPVSALLHSATMVKAGVYLVARLHPALGGTALWDETLTIFGGATMLGGAFLATRQTQFKRVLAYSTVSSLGVLVMLVGMGAAKAAGVYLLAHAMFKGCLFLIAGSVTKMTGEKYADRVGGLVRVMPITAWTAAVGALSMAGMFPLIGFVGKELMLKAGLSHPEWATAVTVVTAIAGTLTVMAALVAGVGPFFGPVRGTRDSTRDPDWRQLAGPVALALAGVVAGLAPWLFAEPLVGAIAASISGEAAPARLRVVELLWPPTTATVLSAAALLIGLGLFLVRERYRGAGRGLAWLGGIGPARWYDLGLSGLFWSARSQTRLLQNGSLGAYVRVTILFVVGIGALAFLRSGAMETISPVLDTTTTLDAILIAVLGIAAVSVTMQRTALASVAVLGGVGFIIALIFALYGAPDVAMTQIAVETLIVIIFVLVIFHLPRYSNYTGFVQRSIDAACAAALGVLMTALTLAALHRPDPVSVAEFYARRSVPEGYGRNVVNVILVDFRSLDTLGEVFVIGVAAIGVYTLLKLRSEPGSACGGVADGGGGR
jgi:multicomponent Na+:H+ antiporter subunit A